MPASQKLALRCFAWVKCATQVPGGLIGGGSKLFEARSARCAGQILQDRKQKNLPGS
jgi:hypothetical protein